MKHSQLQKGFSKVWLIVVALVVIAIAGYMLSTTNTQSSNTNQSSSTQTQASTVVVQKLDCPTYLSAGDVSHALGLSSNTTVTVESTVSTSCRVSWIDPPKNPSVKEVSKGSALFVFGTKTDMDKMISSLCKDKPTAGSNSCYIEKTATSNRGIAFERGNVVVQVAQVSAQSVTDQQLSSLAQVISSKF